MKYIKTIVRIMMCVIKCSPVAAVIGILCSLGFALCTAWGAGILAGLFTQAELLAVGVESKNIVSLSALYIGIIAFRRVLNVISDISFNVGITEKCSYFFRMELHKKVASVPYIDFEDAKVYDQLQRARGSIDNFVITEAFNNILIVGECIISTTGLLVVMMNYSFWYLPILLLTVLPYLLGRIKAGKEFYELRWFQASRTRKRDYLYSVFSSYLSQRELRVFNFGEYIMKKWKKEHDQVAEENISFRKKDSKRLMYCEGVITAGYVLSIMLSVILVFQREIAIGVFGAGIFAFQDVQQSTKSFFSLLGYAFNEVLDANNYFDFLAQEEESEGKEGIEALTEEIEVKNVSFTYPNTGKPALEVKDLTIKAGERVVIVGDSVIIGLS